MVRIERQDPQIKSHSCTLRVMLTSLTLVMGNPVEIAYVCLSPRDSILQLAKQRSLESFDTNLRNQSLSLITVRHCEVCRACQRDWMFPPEDPISRPRDLYLSYSASFQYPASWNTGP